MDHRGVIINWMCFETHNNNGVKTWEKCQPYKLVWGGTTDKAGVSLAELRTKVVDKTAGLEISIEETVPREAFPVVICAGMEYATVRPRRETRRGYSVILVFGFFVRRCRRATHLFFAACE
jgi:hypothetical protein